MVGHRNCAVAGCGNGYWRLKTWSSQVCATHGCNFGTGRCICDPPFVLFPFPPKAEDPIGHKKWISLIARKDPFSEKNWQPNKYSRVCSAHFIDGHPTALHPYPSIHLGYSVPPETTVSRKPPTPRNSAPAQTPRILVDTSNLPEDSDTGVTSAASENVPPGLVSDLESEQVPLTDHDYDGYSGKDETQRHEFLQAKILRLQYQVTFLKSKLQERIKQPFSHTDLKSDRKTKFYTGIPTRAGFDTLFHQMLPRVWKIRQWRGPAVLVNSTKKVFIKTPKKSGKSRKLSGKDEFLLVLMKIRLGLLTEDLADRFGVSLSTCSRIWTTWVKFLASELKCLIFQPDKEIRMQNIPPSFQQAPFRNVAAIVDCSEVFLETPKDPKLQAITWSDYKHHNTAKVLVSITATGHINFVSDVYGGRVTDRYITQQSGFLDIIERDDVVLADRGFVIQDDVATRHAYLYIPPGKRGRSQMTEQEVEKTKIIANHRIYIEQAIRRMKTFRLLKYELPITLVNDLDSILTICAELCNLLPPLVT